MKCIAQEGARGNRLLFAKKIDAEDGVVLDRAEARAWPMMVANAMRSGFWRDFAGDQDEALAELDAAELQPRAGA